MRVPDIFQYTVCFLCHEQPDTHKIVIGGTGVFVAYSEMDIGIRIGYTIAAWHVVHKISQRDINGKVRLRVNTKEDGFDIIETDIEDWVRHPNDTSVDVAVYPDLPPRNKYQYNPFDAKLLLTPEIARAEDIGIGDDVFIPGLFRQSQQDKNLPILRQGTIARMPEAPIPTRDFGSIDAFLIEVRSLGGLSGAPVFVYLTAIRRVRTEYRFQAIAYVLGLIHGHYENEFPEPDELVEDVSQVQQINAGIAVVVPGDKIIETLNHPRLVEMREKRIADNNSNVQPVADFAESEDQNESALTERDFEEALGKATRRKPDGKGKDDMSE